MSISLLDRTQGATAAHNLAKLGASPGRRIKALEREVQTLRRYIAFGMRVPLGVELGDGRHQSDFDALGRLHFYSDDDTVTIQRDPNLKGNAVDFTVTNPGCVNAYNSVAHNTGDTTDASGCDNFAVAGETANGPVWIVSRGAEGDPDMIGLRVWGKATARTPTPVPTHTIPICEIGGVQYELLARATVDPNPAESYTCGSS